MKKLVLALLVAALAISGATAVSAAEISLEAPKATVKIDGVKDAGYGEAYKVATFKDSQASHGTTTTSTSTSK